MSTSTTLDNARAAWGDAIPDWVIVLAEECARTSQSRVAKRLNRSSSLVSCVLWAKYKGDMKAVEDLVRGAFMGGTILCPASGEISTAKCRDWMHKARSFSNTNSERIRMYRACRACPRFRKESEE